MFTYTYLLAKISQNESIRFSNNPNRQEHTQGGDGRQLPPPPSRRQEIDIYLHNKVSVGVIFVMFDVFLSNVEKYSFLVFPF